MDFKTFIVKLSEFYNEKPTKTYTEIMDRRLKRYNKHQLQDLFDWIVNNIDRIYKRLPGPNHVTTFEVEIKMVKRQERLKLDAYIQKKYHNQIEQDIKLGMKRTQSIAYYRHKEKNEKNENS